MTLSVSFDPEIEAKLRERAAAEGKSVEQFVLEAIEEMLTAPAEQTPPDRGNASRDAAGFLQY